MTGLPRYLKDFDAGFGLTLDPFAVTVATAALVLVDLQYFDASRHHGIGRMWTASGGDPAAVDEFFTRVEDVVVPNAVRLVEACRARGVPRLFVRMGMPEPGGAGLPWRYRSFGLPEKLGPEEQRFLDELAPVDGDLVLSKWTSSAFVSTDIDHVLRNLGRDTLVVCGVVTDGCVESTVRDAADHGYRVAIVDDACAALRTEAHQQAIERLDRNYALRKSTDDVLAELG